MSSFFKGLVAKRSTSSTGLVYNGDQHQARQRSQSSREGIYTKLTLSDFSEESEDDEFFKDDEVDYVEKEDDTENLSSWLESMELQFLLKIFQSEAVTYNYIKENGLSKEDLKRLGVTNDIHYRKLRKKSKSLNKKKSFKVTNKTPIIEINKIRLGAVVDKQRKQGKGEVESEEGQWSLLFSESFEFAIASYKGLRVNLLPKTIELNDESISHFKKYKRFSLHPNLIRFFGLTSITRREETRNFGVYESYDQDTLLDLFNSKLKLLQDERIMFKILLGIAGGMVHLHTRGLLHGNLIPENVVVYKDFNVKLKGYGDAKLLGTETRYPLSKKGDIMSFGDILFTLFTGKKVSITDELVDMEKEFRNSRRMKRLFKYCFFATDTPSFAELYQRMNDYYNHLPNIELESFAVSNGQPDKKTTKKDKDDIISGLSSQLDSKEKEISDLKKQLLFSKQPEQRVSESFGKERSITWDAFVLSFTENFNSTEETASKLKSILDKNGMVEKKSWQDFADWFSPFSKANSSDQIEKIANIVGMKWFYGFITPLVAEDTLVNKPEGTYLFRFSTNPACFALSVNYGRVGHWRIVTEEIGTESPFFRIDDRTYRDLDHIIETHREGAEALEIKRPVVKQCYLIHPSDKNETKNDSYYGSLL